MLVQLGLLDSEELAAAPPPNSSDELLGKADDVFDALIKKRYQAIALWDRQLVAA